MPIIIIIIIIIIRQNATARSDASSTPSAVYKLVDVNCVKYQHMVRSASGHFVTGKNKFCDPLSKTFVFVVVIIIIIIIIITFKYCCYIW